MKKILCAILCFLLAASLFSCGQGSSEGVDLRAKLSSLMASDEALGLKGKYETLDDIKDGAVDPDLLGIWKTADEETTYTYTQDGTAKAEVKTYGGAEVKFTCITVDHYKVICEEVPMISSDSEGNQTESIVISYSAYQVENDALYLVNVEDTTDENINSSQYAIIVLYRADENGSIEAALAKNKTSLDTFNGTWSSEEGEFTIQNGKLKIGKDKYDVSVDAKNRLVVGKGESASAYSANISVMKEYDYEDHSKTTESTALGLYFTGADENDKPNLISVLFDWKTEYQWDTWYYSGSFQLEK